MIKGKTTTECKICGSALKREYTNAIDPLTKDRFTISKCVRCGLGHTNPRPDNIEFYYSNYYYGNRHSFMKVYCAQRRIRITKSIIGYDTNKCLLDVGCGDGTFLLAAREKGWKTIGIELNTQPAREAGITVFETIEQAIKFAPFDCISFWHSLEHMPEPEKILKKATKLLKPKGVIIVSLPNFNGLQARFFKRKWFHLDVPRHLYHFDSNSMKYLSNSIGCKIARKWHQELEYDLLGWSQSALNIVFSTQNIFFNSLTSCKKLRNRRLEAASYIIGTIVSALSLPATSIGTLFKSGGTIIFELRFNE